MQREAFAQFAELERDHWWFRGRRRVYLGILERELGRVRPARALDLGCGVGGFLGGLARLAERVIGFEFDEDAIAQCKARGFERLVRSSGDRLPLADASLELITLFDVLEHLDDDRAALAEAHRVLAIGGRCVASVPAFQFLYANNDRVAEHRRRYSRRELVELFESAGFEIERATYANVLLFAPIALAVLVFKVWEHSPFARADSTRTNLSWTPWRPLNEILYRIFAAELAISRRVDLPVGHSVFVIAKKRER